MPVYLDHNATTPLHEQVMEAMMPYMTGIYGNPSSVHRYGRLTRNALEQARLQVAQLVGAQANQIVFTSGGTEANNLAIKGVLMNKPLSINGEKSRFAVSEIEHASLLSPATYMQQQHWQLDKLPVNRLGQVELNSLSQHIHKSTQLVSVMAANNETGVVQDIAGLVSAAKSLNSDVLFHSDACQMAGKLPIDFTALKLDLMSVSAHKMYGPQGVGALVISRSVDLQAQIVGGGQEQKMRSGTENLAAVVGFGAAAELASERLEQRQQHVSALQMQLDKSLQSLAGVEVFADSVERIPNTLLFTVDGIDGEALLMELDKKHFAVSSGSACDSGRTEPSHVLTAMAVSASKAKGAIRVSFGEQNSSEQVTQFVEALQSIKQAFA